MVKRELDEAGGSAALRYLLEVEGEEPCIAFGRGCSESTICDRTMARNVAVSALNLLFL